MRIDDFDYHLPAELIAQKPADKRDESKLLVVHRSSGKLEHKHFFDIADYLQAGDCLVLNNSKVLPARLFGVKEGTGAKIEFLLIKRLEGDIWETMVKPGKRLKPGDTVLFGESPLLRAAIKDYGVDGTRIVEFQYEGVFMERLEEMGSVPLPPYIERAGDADDEDRYQTVYCREEGSVAAPTAGLHFTEELLEKIRRKGVELAYVTLHVGIGTFRPVKCENIEEHSMHFEEYFISEKSAAAINRAKREGRRVVSVGTTSTRTVESAAYFMSAEAVGTGTFETAEASGFSEATGIGRIETRAGMGVFAEKLGFNNSVEMARTNGLVEKPGTGGASQTEEASGGTGLFGKNRASMGAGAGGASGKSAGVWQVKPGAGSTDIFIYPGYEFKIVDCLITNFHLPKSTLLMLISALYDREKILEAYEEAIQKQYRFFSYGDAMYIE